MNWIEVPGGSYQLRNNDRKVSTCQLEFDVRYQGTLDSKVVLTLVIDLTRLYRMPQTANGQRLLLSEF